MYVVTAPVVDVRAVPDKPARSYAHDPHQETQLLAGERVRVHRIQGDWALIEAIEQPEYSHHQRWEGYPGWVLRSALRLLSPHDPQPTTTAPSIPNAEQRPAIIRAAEAFIGTPYLWGGRSSSTTGTSLPPMLRFAEQSVGGRYGRPPFQHGTITGVDCSGLVNLAYRSVGMQIPRDAHEQWMRARPVQQLEPADLIFLSEANHPEKIVHVMLYAGRDQVIEAPGTGQMVRRIRLTSRLGRPVRTVQPGEVVNDQTVFFGSYFSP